MEREIFKKKHLLFVFSYKRLEGDLSRFVSPLFVFSEKSHVPIAVLVVAQSKGHLV